MNSRGKCVLGGKSFAEKASRWMLTDRRDKCSNQGQGGWEAQGESGASVWGVTDACVGPVHCGRKPRAPLGPDTSGFCFAPRWPWDSPGHWVHSSHLQAQDGTSGSPARALPGVSGSSPQIQQLKCDLGLGGACPRPHDPDRMTAVHEQVGPGAQVS